MAIRKFLTSVADVFGYDQDDNLVFTSKTLIDSSLEVTLGSSEVRGGRGNQLLYMYYHTGAMNISLNDTQWNLAFLGQTVGSEVATGNDIYTEETITLTGGGAGTVTGTPIALPNSGVIYGWVSLPDGSTERITFSGQGFTAAGGVSGDEVCVRYYATNSASRSITIPANVLPKVVRLVMEAQLNSGDQASNRIGMVQIVVPRATLSGAFSLSMTSDGVSQTPLSAMALADSDLTSAACSNDPVYAKITEVLDNANWYDGVTALAIAGGDFALSVANSPKTLVVYAIRPGDAPFVVSNASLTFTSSDASKATAGTNTGVITRVAAGSTTIKAVITSNTSIEANAEATVT
jgi:hypothetical protein